MSEYFWVNMVPRKISFLISAGKMFVMINRITESGCVTDVYLQQYCVDFILF